MEFFVWSLDHCWCARRPHGGSITHGRDCRRFFFAFPQNCIQRGKKLTTLCGGGCKTGIRRVCGVFDEMFRAMRHSTYFSPMGFRGFKLVEAPGGEHTPIFNDLAKDGSRFKIAIRNMIIHDHACYTMHDVTTIFFQHMALSFAAFGFKLDIFPKNNLNFFPHHFSRSPVRGMVSSAPTPSYTLFLKVHPL